MVEAGLWESHSRKVKAVHCWRPRRSCFGELVQWDTSNHDWLEGRGAPVRYLERLIDDATRWNWRRFVQHDGTRKNMGVLWEYVERNGRMVDVYTDRASMFSVTPRAQESEDARHEADRLAGLERTFRTPTGGCGGPASSPDAAVGWHRRSAMLEQRVIRNDYTFSFAGKSYQITRM